MRVSVQWLRELCPFEASAEEVATVLTARGLTVDALSAGDGDQILEVDVPANRPDCLGHLGLARELAAAWGLKRAPRRDAPAAEGDPVERLVGVEIESPDLCGRYTARLVRAVRVGPSPPAVRSRLLACGLASINNVVDVSNLVLLELGHPIHTFDFSRIGDRLVRVRRARAGERLKTLDGVDRTLDPEVLVIADSRRPVAVAGILGGLETQITESTREVLIEAAWFLPRSIRAAARRLGLSTDASHRFERGMDPEGVLAAQELAVRLLSELACGVPSPGVVDVHPMRLEGRRLTLRRERIRRILGFDPGVEAMEGALAALGLHPSRSAGPELSVAVPSWRVDIEREEDLVEEVARHLGYDRIPARLPAVGGREAGAEEPHEQEERCRDVLAPLGFQEAFCYSMVGAGEDDPLIAPGAAPALALTNPIAEPMARLRRSLLPGLVRAVDFNLRHGLRDVRLFEVGRVFLARPDGGFPEEPLRVGIAWCGASAPRHWSVSPPQDVELHSLAGVVETLLEAIRPGAVLARIPPPSGEHLPGLHPGRSVVWRGAGQDTVARCGALHPDLREKMDLGVDIFVAEIDLARLGQLPAEAGPFTPLPRVPSVTRDLSLVLDRSVLFSRVLEVLEQVPPPAPAEFTVTDRYEGAPLKPGEVSLTLRVMLQPLERTLTDAETEAYREALVQTLEQRLGVRLRQ